GIGTIGVVDTDVVELSNLHRQTVHGMADIGRRKLDSIADTVAAIDPEIRVVLHADRLDSGNIMDILAGYDLVLDGSDNFPTRYLVNDASVFKKKPVIHGSIFRFEGQVTTFVPGVGPCYRCLYPEPPPAHLAPSCQEAGVLGILPGIVGIVQATEAVKLILGQGTPLIGRLLTYDSLRMKFGELKLRRDKSCPACGESPTITSYIDYEGFCSIG
ncbi:MAG TPA: ThiF family adenylyltransferase, partial [Sorangium sp.]|nr:ThiF family adenylyltransferase [Sorangium sp.]